MEHLSQDIELVFNNRDRLLDAFKLIALKVGVFLEGEIHILLNANVVHDQALILAGIDAVDAGNRLDKAVLLDGLVDVDCVKCRYVEASKPHINNDSNFEV